MTATGPAPAPDPASAVAPDPVPDPEPDPEPVPDPAAGPEAAARPDEARFIADRLLCVVREDIGRADTKSSILLTAALGLPALLLDRNWADGRPGTLAAVLLALGGVFWAAGAVALVRAILPRTKTLRDHDGVTFFADLLTSEGRPRLTEQIVAAGRDPLDWLLVQAVDVSTILAAKYRRIRWGVACLAPGSVLATAGILLT